MDHLVSILLLPWSSRVVPRCQSGPPGCSRGAKMVPRMPKWRHQAPQMATPRSQKGLTAEGVALKTIPNNSQEMFMIPKSLQITISGPNAEPRPNIALTQGSTKTSKTYSGLHV